MKKITSFLLVLTLIFLCVGCNGSETSQEVSETPSISPFVLKLKTEGDKLLSGVLVYVYDESGNNLIWAGETDIKGEVTFDADASKKYTVNFKELPKGYELSQEVQLKAGVNEINFKTVLSPIEDLASEKYVLGSVFGDFSITDVNGKEYKLSEILKEKKAVILNFWFINCGPCEMEFPYLQQAYNDYKDKIEVLAINPYDGTNQTVSQYATKHNLTFPMFSCDDDWQQCMNLTAYPTTVVIDRYGTVAMIHKGSVTDKETFVKVFEYFTSDSYTQTTIRNLDQIK